MLRRREKKKSSAFSLIPVSFLNDNIRLPWNKCDSGFIWHCSLLTSRHSEWGRCAGKPDVVAAFRPCLVQSGYLRRKVKDTLIALELQPIGPESGINLESGKHHLQATPTTRAMNRAAQPLLHIDPSKVWSGLAISILSTCAGSIHDLLARACRSMLAVRCLVPPSTVHSKVLISPPRRAICVKKWGRIAWQNATDTSIVCSRRQFPHSEPLK